MRRSWQGLAAIAAVGVAVIGVGVNSAGGATQTTPRKAHVPVRLAPAPPLPRLVAHAHSSSGSALFLQMPGAPGEVTTPGYVNTIQIFSFSWGVSNTTISGLPGKASLSSLSLQAQLDRSTPVLESWVDTGHVTPSAVLTLADSAGRHFRIVLGQVTVQSVSMGGASGGGLPSVSYSLGFSSEENDYYYNGRVIKNCWDVVTNTASCPSPPA